MGLDDYRYHLELKLKCMVLPPYSEYMPANVGAPPCAAVKISNPASLANLSPKTLHPAFRVRHEMVLCIA